MVCRMVMTRVRLGGGRLHMDSQRADGLGVFLFLIAGGTAPAREERRTPEEPADFESPAANVHIAPQAIATGGECKESYPRTGDGGCD